MMNTPGVVSSSVDEPLTAMTGIPAPVMIGTCCGPNPVNGQTTAATSSSIIWLAQSEAPEALALLPQMTSSIGWPASPPRYSLT